MTLPNVLTLTRIASAPAFLLLFFGDFFTPHDQRLRLLLCLGLVLFSEASDLLDGYFARKYQQVSDFGKLMDPYADSVFRLTVFFSFASKEYGHRWVPLWMVVLLLYRDVLTSVVRTFAIKRGAVIAARLSGKIKAVTEATAIIAILTVAIAYAMSHNFPQNWVYDHVRWIMWITLAVAVWSGIDYFWACRQHFLPHDDENPPPGSGAGDSAHPLGN